MKIGIVASVSEHIDAFWITLGYELENLGHEIYYAAGDEYSDSRYQRLTGLTRRPSAMNAMAPSQLRRWCSSNVLDLVLTNTATASAIVRFSRIPAPVVYFAHGLHWSKESGPDYRLWSMIEKAALLNTLAMIVLNREDEAWVRRVGFAGPTLRLDYGVGLPLNRFPQSSNPRNNRAVWIGEFSPRKRPLLAVKTAQLIKYELPDFQLSMLGRGELVNEAVALAEKLGLGATIEFPGHVNPSPYLTHSTILLHTATWEGLPRVVLEAIAVGRPVVGPDVKGLRQVPGVTTSADETPESIAQEAINCLNEPPTGACVSRETLGTAHAAREISEFLRSLRR